MKGLFDSVPFLALTILAPVHGSQLFDSDGYRKCLEGPLFDNDGRPHVAKLKWNDDECTIDMLKMGKELGSGFQGTVYSSRLLDDIPVAVKVFKTLNRKNYLSIAQEVCLLAHLKHPYIPKFYCSFLHEDGAFLVMEQIDAFDGVDYIDTNTSMPLDAWLKVLEDSAQFLEFLHQQGLAYRDFKPDNLMIHPDTHKSRLVDFGLSIEVGKKTLIAGTLSYMAPELAGLIWKGAAKAVVDPRADWYSLAITLNILLTGVNASPEDSDYRSLLAIVKHGLNKYALPEAPIDQLIEGLTRINPYHRWGGQQINDWLEVNRESLMTRAEMEPFAFRFSLEAQEKLALWQPTNQLAFSKDFAAALAIGLFILALMIMLT